MKNVKSYLPIVIGSIALILVIINIRNPNQTRYFFNLYSLFEILFAVILFILFVSFWIYQIWLRDRIESNWNDLISGIILHLTVMTFVFYLVETPIWVLTVSFQILFSVIVFNLFYRQVSLVNVKKSKKKKRKLFFFIPIILIINISPVYIVQSDFLDATQKSICEQSYWTDYWVCDTTGKFTNFVGVLHLTEHDGSITGMYLNPVNKLCVLDSEKKDSISFTGDGINVENNTHFTFKFFKQDENLFNGFLTYQKKNSPWFGKRVTSITELKNIIQRLLNQNKIPEEEEGGELKDTIPISDCLQYTKELQKYTYAYLGKLENGTSFIHSRYTDMEDQDVYFNSLPRKLKNKFKASPSFALEPMNYTDGITNKKIRTIGYYACDCEIEVYPNQIDSILTDSIQQNYDLWVKIKKVTFTK